MYEIYTVSNTDTLSQIAKRYGTTEDMLIQINGFSKNYQPTANTQIIVPTENNDIYKYYTVKKGDNITLIARQYNLDPTLLLKLNGLDKDDYIYPNQTILLPKNGLSVYLTKQGDTLSDIAENLNTTTEKILKENPRIYLTPEQILIFKEK